MKEFTKFQVATIKRVAQSVSPLVRVKERLTREINERKKELESIQIQIDAFQGPIREMTGGFSSEDLVKRVVEITDKLDKEGKPIKVTKWVLKYPDTVIPQTEEIRIPESQLEEEQIDITVDAVKDPVGGPVEAPMPAAGSDFDIDVPQSNDSIF